jgi:16S rRNA (cytosine967-C5)-methyltransferase
MIGPARVAAYDILTALSSGRSDLPGAIASTRGALHDERDRALAAEIAAGVQRSRGALDHLIEHFSKRPITRLDDEVVDILRLSAYQLLHLTRVPAAAVVDDAVNLAKRAGKTSASGLVNAVLRAIARARSALPLPPRPADPTDRASALAYFSVTLSHPRWLAERWLDRVGFAAAERWLQFDNTAAPLTLRANRLRVTPTELAVRLEAENIALTPGRFAPDALIVNAGHPLRGAGLELGWFVVQDEASQLVALLAGDDPARRLLDTCASPGGKTTAMAAMRPEALIVACDVREKRVELLRRVVAASGAANVRIVQADLLQPLPFSARFDCVLVDAPCSGLGTLRRDPDIRWRRRESDLAPLANAQRLMLRHASGAVAPGGRLVYATCSSEPEENEDVAAGFLRDADGFEAIDARRAAPRLPAAVVDSAGCLRTLPYEHGLEAFFGAVFRRTAP